MKLLSDPLALAHEEAAQGAARPRRPRRAGVRPAGAPAGLQRVTHCAGGGRGRGDGSRPREEGAARAALPRGVSGALDRGDPDERVSGPGQAGHSPVTKHEAAATANGITVEALAHRFLEDYVRLKPLRSIPKYEGPIATHIAEQHGVGGEQLIRRVLAHSDGSVTAAYNRCGYLKEMRQVLTAWAEALMRTPPEPKGRGEGSPELALAAMRLASQNWMSASTQPTTL
jgi:hypothetical protein